MADDEAPPINLTIKGPSGLSLPISISPDATVGKLKEEIASKKEDFPAASQRLIYSGKVLKDAQQVKEYKVQDGHTIHMVRSAGAAPAALSGGSGASASSTNATSSASNSSEARGVPSNFGAGQQFTNNPLSALNRADLAGPQLANFNPFAGTGANLNDPNFMMNLMEDEGFRAQMRGALARPEVVDQIISMNPSLSAMRPQLQQMLQSEQFREMLTNPEMMRQAQQMQSMFGGAGGLGGGMFGGLGGAGGGSGGGAQWPPAGAFGGRGATDSATTGSAGTGGNNGGSTGAQGGAGGAAPNLFDMLGQMGGMGGFGAGAGGAGAGGGGAGAANPFGMNPEMMRMLAGLGGGGGMFGGSGGGAGAAPGDSRPPEQRYATQLEQMQGMGFSDGARNLRALLMSGGSVEGAINLLLEGGI